jgi:hypothetical protein
MPVRTPESALSKARKAMQENVTKRKKDAKAAAVSEAAANSAQEAENIAFSANELFAEASPSTMFVSHVLGLLTQLVASNQQQLALLQQIVQQNKEVLAAVTDHSSQERDLKNAVQPIQRALTALTVSQSRLAATTAPASLIDDAEKNAQKLKECTAVVYNVPETESDPAGLLDLTKTVLGDELGDTVVQSAERVGVTKLADGTVRTKPRLIKVKFSSLSEKLAFMRRSHNVFFRTRRDLGDEKAVNVDYDLTALQRQNRRSLLASKRLLRDNGFKAYFVADKLTVPSAGGPMVFDATHTQQHILAVCGVAMPAAVQNETLGTPTPHRSFASAAAREAPQLPLANQFAGLAAEQDA